MHDYAEEMVLHCDVLGGREMSDVNKYTPNYDKHKMVIIDKWTDIEDGEWVSASDYEAFQRRVEELEGQLKKEQRLDECAGKMVAVTERYLEAMPRSELISLVYKNMGRVINESLEMQALEKQINTLTARLAACQEALIEAKTEIEYMCESELASDKPYGWKRVVVAIDKALAQEGP